MSRFAEVIVIARDAKQVMEPLTQSDENREWHQCFVPIGEGLFDAWAVEFWRLNWHGLVAYLESLPWPDPHSVQVLIHDEEDDCFGLWMMYDNRLVEVPLPRTERHPFPGNSVTGVLTRTDRRSGGSISSG
ncbi:hypothetical protein [Actinacidiphila glaucinigra]|uniref:Uncharacterized protein n=1 Tax=Actinacidiphila glaucinigra TaxID=235986 RepID=A0A239JQD1_9ACTN|nr:hypothetical protein [Actinacidiphila glaucinigra]SNT07563.1 hypothetical protein SAMN05216252_113138 [Actinacidiphila glaucinigra]